MKIPGHDKLISNTGGTEALRGFEFQAYSTMYYLLMRLQRYPGLTMKVESIEDAVIDYSADETSGLIVHELVQCKKVESGDSSSIRRGYGDDIVKLGRFSPTQLKIWVEDKRRGLSVAELLSQSPTTVYTTLLLTALSESLSPFQPWKHGEDDATTLWCRPDFNECFPVEYQHGNDPVNKKKHLFCSENVRKKIRVVILPTWAELRIACQMLLTSPYYRIPASNSDCAMSMLMQRYAECSVARNAVDKVLSKDAIESIIGDFRPERSSWRRAAAWLQSEEWERPLSRYNQPLYWRDFQAGKYVELPQFEEALKAIDDHGFVVIHGHPGAGKSTLARFLTYRYLSQNAGAQGYHLLIARLR
jgi:hypothetical protein